MEKVPVVNNRGELLGYCHPAVARMLISEHRARYRKKDGQFQVILSKTKPTLGGCALTQSTST